MSNGRISRMAQLGVVLLAGCGTSTVSAPPELEAARRAFRQAMNVPAGQAPLAELERARQSLDRAEQAFAEDPEATATRDLAYVALRSAERARSLSVLRSHERELAELRREKAEREARLRRQRAERVRALAAEQARSEAARQQAREAARRKVEEAVAELRELGQLSDEQQGIVLRIPERVLFRRATDELTSSATDTIQQVARALQKLERATFVVAAHSDGVGDPGRSRRLTLKQADRVREALLSAGLQPQRVAAVGKGGDEPIVDKGSAFVRARNRRIEIVIARPPPSPHEEDVYSGLLAR